MTFRYRLEYVEGSFESLVLGRIAEHRQIVQLVIHLVQINVLTSTRLLQIMPYVLLHHIYQAKAKKEVSSANDGYDTATAPAATTKIYKLIRVRQYH